MFEPILKITLRYEGGYVNHPSDPGGATNFGITQGTYDKFRDGTKAPRQSVRSILPEEVHHIYLTRYWLANKCDTLPAPLALMHFDACVNHGPKWANGFLERSGGDWRLYLAERIAFFCNLTTFNTFGRGWMRRCADIQKEAIKLEQQHKPTLQTFVLHRPGREPFVTRVPFVYTASSTKLDVRFLEE